MRGDGVVMGAALLLFIASFLDVASAGGLGSNAWDNLGLAMSMYVGGVIGAALIVLSRSSSQPRKVAGLDIRQFGIALTVFAGPLYQYSERAAEGIDSGSYVAVVEGIEGVTDGG
jgi:hypothetical protein